MATSTPSAPSTQKWYRSRSFDGVVTILAASNKREARRLTKLVLAQNQRDDTIVTLVEFDPQDATETGTEATSS